MDTNALIQELATDTGLSKDLIQMAAQMAANFLSEQYGSDEEAAAQLEGDHSNAIAGLMHATQSVETMGEAMVANPTKAAKAVLKAL